MTEKKQNTHPFGRLLTHYLRQSQISQSHFAEMTGISDSVISHMKNGRRLNGDNARERILKMIEYFHQRGVLTTRQEGNEFLAKAGMLPLSSEPFDKWCLTLEPKLYDLLVDNGVESGNGRDTLTPAMDREVGRRFKLLVFPRNVWLGVTAVILLTLFILYAYHYYQTRGWTLRINRTDDLNVVLVNNEITAVDGGRYEGPPMVINLNKHLEGQETSVITLVNINGKSRAWWDFEIRYNDNFLWRYERKSEKAYQMNYAQQLQLTADGQLMELPPPSTGNSPSIPITITLDVQKLALVLVNDFPVGAASDSPSGEFIPIEISPFLRPDHSNTLEFKFWSVSNEPYRWEVEIWQGDLLWRCAAGGLWQSESELTEEFVIDDKGSLVYTTRNGSCYQYGMDGQ